MSNIIRTEAFDNRLEGMDDEEIIEAVHQGHSEALDFLIRKYRNFVRAKARSYFLIGADKEDIVQEGMIGLYKAINLKQRIVYTMLSFFSTINKLHDLLNAVALQESLKHMSL